MNQRAEILQRAKARLEQKRSAERQFDGNSETDSVQIEGDKERRYIRRALNRSRSPVTILEPIKDKSEIAGPASSELKENALHPPKLTKGNSYRSRIELNEIGQQLNKLVPFKFMKIPSALLGKGVKLVRADYLDGIDVTSSPKKIPEPLQKLEELTRKKKSNEEATCDEDIQVNRELQEILSSSNTLNRYKWTFTTLNFSLLYVFPRPVNDCISEPIFTVSSYLDGLYVAEPPPIREWNYQRLLNRLLATEPDKRWFSGPRSLAILPDPMSYVHYRPESLDRDIETGQMSQIDLITKRPFYSFEMQEISRLLMIDLVSLALTSHPLMLPEQKLALSLKSLVRVYEERRRSNVVWFLNEKIESLLQEFKEKDHRIKTYVYEEPSDSKAKRRNTIKKLNIIRPKRKSDLTELEREAFQLLKDIKANRLLRDTEAQTDRLLEYKIVKAWEEIKKVRNEQGFTSIGTKLAIHLKENATSFDFEAELEKELQERELLIQYSNQMAKKLYEEQLEQWEYKYQKFLQSKSLDRGIHTVLEVDESEGSTNNLLADELLMKKYAKKHSKPTEPDYLTLNVKKDTMDIMKRLKKSYPSASYPSFAFILSDEAQLVTVTSECPLSEQIRRAQLETVRISLELTYNSVPVTRTIGKQLNINDFTIHFCGSKDIASKIKVSSSGRTTAFGVQVRERPRSISLKLYDELASEQLPLCEIYLPVPSESDNFETIDREYGKYEFSSNDSAAKDRISGNVKVNIFWGDQQSGEFDLNPEPKTVAFYDPLSSHGPVGLLNLPKMIEWVSKTTFDPNDPRNSELLSLKQLITKVCTTDDIGFNDVLSKWSQSHFFRAGLPKWLNNILFAVGPDNLEHYQKRFDLLIKRFKREIIIPQPIPLHVTDGMFDHFLVPAAAAEEVEINAMKKWNSRHLLDEPKVEDNHVDLGFVKRIRDMQLIRKAALQRPRNVDHYVSEARLIMDDEAEFDLFAIFRPFRPLNPYRTNRKTFSSVDVDHCRLVVQILQGYNFPIRNESRTSKKNEPELRPFIEVSFQKRKLRTVTSVGTSPTWNETVILDVKSPNSDFKPESLIETDIVTEILYLNIFDEVIVDLIEDDQERERSTYIRRDRVWLGSIEIPFSTIWERNRVDGRFKVFLPPSLLGYTSEQSSQKTANNCLLHVFITLDPPLSQPPLLDLKFQSDESQNLLNHAKKWEQFLDPTGTKFFALTNDLTGKSTLICRFIRPQNPPTGLVTPEQLARYVSRIPFLPNRAVFTVRCNLCSTSDQVLNVGAGDALEHAILLCNYFLFTGYNAYVAFGQTLIDSNTTFVIFYSKTTATILEQPPPEPGSPTKMSFKWPNLEPSSQSKGKSVRWPSVGSLNGAKRDTKVQNPLRICHPISGTIYELTDMDCPLTELFGVFDEKNVYHNAQVEKLLAKMKFNFQDSTAWRPLFAGGLPIENQLSIQPAELYYKDTSPQWISHLEERIEKSVMLKFESWRKGTPTRWNRRSLKTLLSTFEGDVIADNKLSIVISESKELKSISNVYKIKGLPFNLPFTDIAAIADAVFNLDIHSNVTNGVEFAMAVHCVGYPGKFVSVWVFICDLLRRGL